MRISWIAFCALAITLTTALHGATGENPNTVSVQQAAREPAEDIQRPTVDVFSDADYSTYTGTLKFVFAIELKSGIPNNATLVCEASALAKDPAYGAYNQNETKSVAATRSGNTASCTVTIPYRWSLLTARVPSLYMLMNYSVYTAYPDNAAPGSMARRVYGYIPTGFTGSDIKVPPSGATLTFKVNATL